MTSKHFTRFSVLIAVLALSASHFARAEGISIIKDMPEALFAPPGFDSNDHAQIVLSGSFINTCYKVGPNQAEVDVVNQTIHVTQQAYLLDTPWCLHVLVPYTTVVDVGILPPGNYDVHVRAEASREKDFGKMGIVRAAESSGSAPDEKLYAMVDEVSYENSVLTLKGKLPAPDPQEPNRRSAAPGRDGQPGCRRMCVRARSFRAEGAVQGSVEGQYAVPRALAQRPVHQQGVRPSVISASPFCRPPKAGGRLFFAPNRPLG